MPPKNALGKAKASLRPPTAKAKTKSKAKPKAKAKVGVGYTLVVAAGPNGELPEVKKRRKASPVVRPVDPEQLAKNKTFWMGFKPMGSQLVRDHEKKGGSSGMSADEEQFWLDGIAQGLEDEPKPIKVAVEEVETDSKAAASVEVNTDSKATACEVSSSSSSKDNKGDGGPLKTDKTESGDVSNDVQKLETLSLSELVARLCLSKTVDSKELNLEIESCVGELCSQSDEALQILVDEGRKHPLLSQHVAEVRRDSVGRVADGQPLEADGLDGWVWGDADGADCDVVSFLQYLVEHARGLHVPTASSGPAAEVEKTSEAPPTLPDSDTVPAELSLGQAVVTKTESSDVPVEPHNQNNEGKKESEPSVAKSLEKKVEPQPQPVTETGIASVAKPAGQKCESETDAGLNWSEEAKSEVCSQAQAEAEDQQDDERESVGGVSSFDGAEHDIGPVLMKCAMDPWSRYTVYLTYTYNRYSIVIYNYVFKPPA